MQCRMIKIKPKYIQIHLDDCRHVCTLDVAVGTTTTTGSIESNTVIITAISASTALLIAVVVGLVCCYWRKVKTGGATSTMNNQNRFDSLLTQKNATP